MKKIYFVKDEEVWENIQGSAAFDKDSFAGVFFVDFPEKFSGNRVPNIEINGLEKFSNSDVSGVIAVNTGMIEDLWQFSKSYLFLMSLEIARTLKQNGIKFSFWGAFSPYLHVHGKFPAITFELGRMAARTKCTAELIDEIFKTFPQEFIGKEIDMWIAIEDSCATDALDLAEALDLPRVFSYYSTYALKDRVIAFPDYKSCYNEEKFWDSVNVTSKCLEAAAKPYQDEHLFWRGSTFTTLSRRCLFELGKKYQQYFKIEDMTRGGEFIPMVEQSKYKYLIDTRGNAWSDRLQILLKLGRVVFIVDRPYREWFFDKMRPMEHYVPVEEDLSDLLEKFFYMESHPELYDKISRNLKEFVLENLTPQKILLYAKELILRYGVVN